MIITAIHSQYHLGFCSRKISDEHYGWNGSEISGPLRFMKINGLSETESGRVRSAPGFVTVKWQICTLLCSHIIMNT